MALRPRLWPGVLFAAIELSIVRLHDFALGLALIVHSQDLDRHRSCERGSHGRRPLKHYTLRSFASEPAEPMVRLVGYGLERLIGS